MHIRRLAAFLLGAWLAGSFFMVLVATHNLAAVERLLASPPRQVGLSVELLSEPVARNFFRYQANELNRWYFESWEWIQMILGVALLGALIASGRRRQVLILSGLMLLAVAVMRFALTPQITRLGRLIEFSALNQRAVERATFGHFHAMYLVAEGLKILFGLMLLSSLLRRHSTRPEPDPKDARWVRAD